VREFRDRVIWITGASSGIGKEMAIQSAKLGASLVLSARNTQALEELQDQLSDTPTLVLPMDMADSENFPELAQKVIGKFGQIDLVFMSAGISQRSEVIETEMSIDRRIMEVNFFGNIALAKAVLPQMRKQKSGRFCVISSITGKTGFFLRASYAASKHALHGYFESLRMEEYENNIKVHIICPGPVNTNISLNSIDASGQAQGIHDPMQEMGMTPEECVDEIIRSIRKDDLEKIISKGSEAFGMKLKALFPGLYFKIARRRNPRG
jgi:dehydrogenase/reductase SDR family protein 7B